MDTLNSILERARSLSHADRVRLAQTLFEQVQAEQADEVDAGLRGLAAWTESTRDEDWAQFYPDNLRQRRVG